MPKGGFARFAGLIRQPAAVIAATVGALVLAVVLSHHLWHTTSGLAPDDPPAEYLYLDSQRVNAYLGQIQGGLALQETRNVTETSSSNVDVGGGLLKDLNQSNGLSQSVTSVVTPLATDRFYTLLLKLRQGSEHRNGTTVPWLPSIDAQITSQNSVDRVRAELRDLREGDFVRIYNARLFLPPYASFVPKAHYADPFLSGGFNVPPSTSVAAAQSIAQREKIDSYLRELGNDPTLPFVAYTLPSLNSQIVTFLVPARYRALLDNGRLLTGRLIIVGKVIYKDLRRTNDSGCGGGETVNLSCEYVDRQTVQTYGSALLKAPQSILSYLGVTRRDVVGNVSASMTFRAPVLVVLPVAIYQ
jgi:hypothetical protein